MTMDATPGDAPATATIVAADAVDKLAALATISRVVGAPVSGAGTATPTIALADGVWVQIEIPKFGEPPPLAIDVHAAAGSTVAREHAEHLLALLQRHTAWDLVRAYPVAVA